MLLSHTLLPPTWENALDKEMFSTFFEFATLGPSRLAMGKYKQEGTGQMPILNLGHASSRIRKNKVMFTENCPRLK